MKQVSGFTLIELTVGLFISSMLAMILFGSYMQSQKAIQRTNEVINRDFQLMILYRQFTRDFTGMFVPYTFEKAETDSGESGDSKKDTAQEGVQQPQPAQPQPQRGQKQPKLKRIPIKQPLVVTRAGNNVQMVSFVTNNPLNVYGKPVPCMVRMAYYLEPDDKNPDLYALYRAESPTVDYEQFKEEKPYRYLLARSVKEFSLDFYAVKKDEPDKESDKDSGKKSDKKDSVQKDKPAGPDQPAEREEPKILEFVQLTEWNDEALAENEEIIKGALPYTVRVKIGLWDIDIEQSREYSFFLRVWAYTSGIVPESPKRRAPQAPGGAAGTPPVSGSTPAPSGPKGPQVPR